MQSVINPGKPLEAPIPETAITRFGMCACGKSLRHLINAVVKLPVEIHVLLCEGPIDRQPETGLAKLLRVSCGLRAVLISRLNNLLGVCINEAFNEGRKVGLCLSLAKFGKRGDLCVIKVNHPMHAVRHSRTREVVAPGIAVGFHTARIILKDNMYARVLAVTKQNERLKRRVTLVDPVMVIVRLDTLPFLRTVGCR